MKSLHNFPASAGIQRSEAGKKKAKKAKKSVSVPNTKAGMAGKSRNVKSKDKLPVGVAEGKDSWKAAFA